MTRFPYSRLSYVLLIVPLLLATASAAGTRSVHIQNESSALIDAGFLQPPSSSTLSTYGTIHAGKSQTFTLAEGAAKIAVRSTACHGSAYAELPQKPSITVVVEKGCKLIVK